MKLRFCTLCSKEFGTPGVVYSHEHIIPNSLGGPKKVKGIICKACNNRTVLDYLRWRINAVPESDSIFRNMYKTGDTVILDFGRHLTGILSIDVEGVGVNVDSPARIRFDAGGVGRNK